MKKSGYIIILFAAIAIGVMIGYYIGIRHNAGQIEIMHPISNTAIVNINTATIDELVELPGFGEITAQRIIDYRERKGNYQTVDDLLNVSGIAEDKLQQIRHLLTVE